MLLKNVFHVPESLLCKNDLKVLLESKLCVLTKSGIFVGKGYSYDGIFKLNLNINKVMNFAYIVDSFNIYYACLAHLNFRSLKYMSKHDLISCKMIVKKNVKSISKKR